VRLSLQKREQASTLRAQILNLTGIRKAGFFLQYDHVADTEKQRPYYPEVAQLFEGRRQDFERLLDNAASDAPALCDDTVAPAINWGAAMFPPLDALFTYTILKRSGAAKVLEIGSGASTRAIVRGLAASTRPGQLTCIDPAPRQDISGLGARHIRRVMRESDVSLVDDFAANDVVFIASSHYMLPGTDVDLQFNRIFPRLKPGGLFMCTISSCRTTIPRTGKGAGIPSRTRWSAGYFPASSRSSWPEITLRPP